jgi:hypothetical protein
MVMACEEAGADGADPEKQSSGPADLGAGEGYGVGEGPIAGLTEALRRDPSLVPLLSTTLLEVLVRVEHRDGRGAVASASQEQVMAATGLIKRLLQPAALPQPSPPQHQRTALPASPSGQAASGEPARDAILFFTSDLRVLVDICVREVVDLPDADPLRAEFLQLLRDVLLFSQWAGEGMYRADDIVSIVSDLVTTGAADAEPAVRDAAEALLVDCRDLLDD